MSNRSVKLAIAICALMTLLVGGARGESSWQRFTATVPGGGSFSVEIPQAPKYQAVQDAAGNIQYKGHIWSVELDQSRAYIVSVTVFPVDVGAANARRLLEGALKGVATRTSTGQWGSVEWKQHQGLLAFDAVGTGSSGRDIRIFCVAKATRVFSLNYSGLAGTARSADVNRFIASLKIQ